MSCLRVWTLVLLLLCVYARGQHCLDSGLAGAPPMGWSTAERFQCNVDCLNYPDDCVSDKLVRTTADAMVTQGLRDAGYKYLVLGDCWMNKTRDSSGQIVADPARFPGGLKSLANYLHAKGFLLGVTLDLGNTTCNGYPGSGGHNTQDAHTLASWEVDMVNVTACHVTSRATLNSVYPAMRKALNQTGRHMLYACDWPLKLKNIGAQPDYGAISRVCHVYSTYAAMLDSWESLEAAIKNFATTGHDVMNYTGPGSWNLPNLLLVGDYGLSLNEQKMLMSVWSIMAAPLFVSADLRHLDNDQLQILVSKASLAIDQDPLFNMGIEVQLLGQVHIWRKRIQPTGSYAILFMYFNVSGGPSRVSIVARDLGLMGAAAYRLTDIWTGRTMGVYKPWYTFNCEVDPVGSVFIRAEPLP